MTIADAAPTEELVWRARIALSSAAGAGTMAIVRAVGKSKKFGGERLQHEPWKTASLRDTTIRLVRSGMALMRGGYRTLLGPRRLE